MTSSPLVEAIRYAERGWRVVPLHTPSPDGCSCHRGLRCTSAGKHPRTINGVTDASSEAAQVRRWWHCWPSANIGIAAGGASGLIVIDIDPRNGGSLEAIEDRYGAVPPTVTSHTGGGGLHLLFVGKWGRSCALTGVQGVDILADGKLFVAPPSLHPSGNGYAWKVGRSPSETTIAVAPAWLDALCQPSASPKQVAMRPSQRFRALPKSGSQFDLAVAAMLRLGVRGDESDGSNRLIRYARLAVERGLSESDAIAAIRVAEDTYPFPRSWSDAEILKRIADASGRSSSEAIHVSVPRNVALRIRRKAASRG